MISIIYCPQCKKPLHKKGRHFYCKSCKDWLWQNSVPGCGALIVKSGKVLLARRKRDPYRGELDTIGGFQELGEHPKDGTIREVKEETGYDIKTLDLLGIYMEKLPDGRESQSTFYVAKIVGGRKKVADDVASLHWFSIEEPPKSKGFKNVNWALRDLQKWYKKNK